MPKLLFFSRVALLCNLCFMLTFLMHHVPSIKDGVFVSTILVMGLVLSVVINVVINLFYLIAAFAGKPLSLFVPRWIIVSNFLFFIFQAILLVK